MLRTTLCGQVLVRAQRACGSISICHPTASYDLVLKGAAHELDAVHFPELGVYREIQRTDVVGVGREGGAYKVASVPRGAVIGQPVRVGIEVHAYPAIEEGTVAGVQDTTGVFNVPPCVLFAHGYADHSIS